MQEFLRNLVIGVQAGAVYALIAVGYTMVYGVLRLINFAHGDVYMFGAFMGYYLARMLQGRLKEGSSLEAALVMAGSMLISAFLGIVIERFAYRPGRSRAPFTLAFWLGIMGLIIGYIA